MKKEETFKQEVKKAIEENVQELLGKYTPGPVFEEWVSEFKIAFMNCKWSSESVMNQAMSNCIFWIECLLKTWREEIGPEGKRINFLKGKESELRPELGL